MYAIAQSVAPTVMDCGLQRHKRVSETTLRAPVDLPHSILRYFIASANEVDILRAELVVSQIAWHVWK